MDHLGDHFLPLGNLSLRKLVYEMNFDVNALDKNGESALHHLFRASDHKERTNLEHNLFMWFTNAGYDLDPLMEYLGKHLTLFGRKGYGPCLLLELAKCLNRSFVPRSEIVAFGIL